MITNYFLELGMNTEHCNKILDLAHETGALLHGQFTLSSGKRSDHYFDGKMLTSSPEALYQIGKIIFDELKTEDVDAIGGLAMGALPIAYAVSVVSYLEGRPIPNFIVRDKAKEHGTRKIVEGRIKEHSRVVIVDDVITGGKSVFKAIEEVKAIGCEVIKVIVIVDRQEGGSELLKEKGYNFDAIIKLPPSGEAGVSESSAVTGDVR